MLMTKLFIKLVSVQNFLIQHLKYFLNNILLLDRIEIYKKKTY